MESNPCNIAKALFRKGDPKRQGPAVANGDGAARRQLVRRAAAAPDVPRDADVVTEARVGAYASALERNGFFGPDSYYMNPTQRRLCGAAR